MIFRLSMQSQRCSTGHPSPSVVNCRRHFSARCRKGREIAAAVTSDAGRAISLRTQNVWRMPWPAWGCREPSAQARSTVAFRRVTNATERWKSRSSDGRAARAFDRLDKMAVERSQAGNTMNPRAIFISPLGQSGAVPLCAGAQRGHRNSRANSYRIAIVAGSSAGSKAVKPRSAEKPMSLSVRPGTS
jgi:hypothetical protein